MDLDGTLVNSQGITSTRARIAIAQAQAQGVLVTLATGRSFPAVQSIALELGLNAPVILYNGACIRYPSDGRILFQRPIAIRLARKIIRFLRQKKLSPVAFVDDGLYSDQPISPNISPHSGLNGMTLNILGNALEQLDRAPEKIAVIVSAKNANRLAKQLRVQAADEISLTHPYPTVWEMTHQYSSKGRALRWLAKHLNVPRRQVLAVGDGDNDIDMIEWAGLSVAMGNAPRSIRLASDYVTDSVENDGLAKAIEHFVL